MLFHAMPGVKIGEVEKNLDVALDVVALIGELLASCRLANTAVQLDDTHNITARQLAYARSVGGGGYMYRPHTHTACAQNKMEMRVPKHTTTKNTNDCATKGESGQKQWRTAGSEFLWCNRYFWHISQATVAKGDEDPAPTHSDWLRTYAPSVVSSRMQLAGEGLCR